MSDFVIVRFAVAIFFGFAFAVSYVIWKSAAAPDALQNVGIAVAALLPVLIAVSPSLERVTKTKSFDIAVFFDTKEKRLFWGDKDNPFSNSQVWMSANLHKIPGSTSASNLDEVRGRTGLNYIERGLLVSIGLPFQATWDVGPQVVRKFPQGSMQGFPARSMAAGTEYGSDEVAKIFSHNPLFGEKELQLWPKIVLPPACTLSSEFEEASRRILIRNPDIELAISIKPNMSMVTQRGVLGVYEPDPVDMNRYFQVIYEVSVDLKSKPLLRHAPIMSSYSRWFDAITTEIERLSWKYVDKEILENLLRESLRQQQTNH